jgi:hypothetical protein
LGLIVVRVDGALLRAYIFGYVIDAKEVTSMPYILIAADTTGLWARP